MNKLFACLALAFVAPIFSSLYAQEGPPPEQYEPPPPVGMDVDYFAPPKQKLSVGFSVLTGPKVSFSGSGIIPSGVNPGADSTTTTRTYNDGTISPDTRTDAASGQPLQSIPATADGKTNTWSFTNAAQMDAANNGVDMHAYSATIDGNNPHSGRAASGTGFELTFDRDFGWHLGKIKIDIIAGLGLNKISYSRTENVAAMMTTQTDVYATENTNLDSNGDLADTSYNTLPAGSNPTYTLGVPSQQSSPGVNPPVPITPPYSGPSSSTDTSGKSVDNSTISGSEPIPNPNQPTNGPAAGITTAPAEVTEQWNINGAYFTLRAGPEITIPITEKFSASVSGGPALVYVGTTFSVNQTLTPPTGSPITSTVSEDFNTVLPAYFANANIEYTLTDTTGLYLGAVFQSTTGYTQTINSQDGNYTNKLDFGTQEGVRAGISFKF
jgi:hypothetical protein